MIQALKSYAPLGLIIFIALIAYYFEFYEYFSLENFRSLHTEAQDYIIHHPVLSPFLFIAIFFTYSLLALPGSFVLTILSGLLFPLPLSTLYVLIGDTAGSCMLFLCAKAAIKSPYKIKRSPFLSSIEKNFIKNHIGYMLLFRFIPIFPFWFINVIPAFFGIRFSTFLWTTIVGLIPENLVLTASASIIVKILISNN